MTERSQRLGDRVVLRSHTDVKRAFLDMEASFRLACDWITSNAQRDNRNVALFNLLSASSAYLHVAADSLTTHVSVLALATRSLYELNLRTRHILMKEENLLSWIAEAGVDRIEALEGILGIPTVGDVSGERALIREHIDRLKSIATKHRLPNLRKLPSASAIADSVGRSSEHKALFKLFSKLVHPSSYLVNGYENAASSQVLGILQIHAQMYGLDTFNRVCEAIGIPEELRKPPPSCSA